MRRASLLLLGVALGCPSPTTTPPPPTEPEPAPPAAESPPPVQACAPAAFAAVAPIPPSARAAALLDTTAPDLDGALAAVKAVTDDGARTLPIRIAFSLGQWTWQVPLLRRTLEQAGFVPDALLYVALPDGSSAWAWPQDCDLDAVRQNLASGWGMSLRNTAYGAVATAPLGEDGTPAFAYDFVAWGATAYLVVPAGRASLVTQLLAERPTDSAAATLGDHIDALPPGPIRLAVRMDDLVTPGAAAPSEGTIASHRVDAQGWAAPDDEGR
ncbi:MAG: hypothetical protein AAGA54_23195 [Myxococcota bacterium]